MNSTGITGAPIPWHSSSCSQFEPVVSPGFDFVRCLTCGATHVYDPVARRPEAPPDPCDATSFDQKTTDDVAISRSISPPRNEPLRALFDFTQLCAQWRRVETVVEPLLPPRSSPRNQPLFRPRIRPSECDSHCTGCDVLLRAVRQLRGQNGKVWEVCVALRSFKGASFLSISEFVLMQWSAVLCAVNG